MPQEYENRVDGFNHETREIDQHVEQVQLNRQSPAFDDAVQASNIYPQESVAVEMQKTSAADVVASPATSHQ